jgi:hypothetical protein
MLVILYLACLSKSRLVLFNLGKGGTEHSFIGASLCFGKEAVPLTSLISSILLPALSRFAISRLALCAHAVYEKVGTGVKQN